MPFKKTGTDEWTSPSGKKWTRKQMQAYKSRKGKNNPNSRTKRSKEK